MSHIHIHAPAPTRRSVHWNTCADCKKRSPFAVLFFDWYEPTATCMRCGRHYQGGAWCQLDFSRTARADSKRQARQAWKRATSTPEES